MNDGSSMFFGGGFMWLIWIVIIAVVVYAVKAGINSGSMNNDLREESPLEILKKRYARGEIDEQEYERRRNELEGK